MKEFLREYNDIYHQNWEVMKKNKWFAPALLVSFTAFIVWVCASIYAWHQASEIGKEKKEIEDLEKELEEVK